MEIKYELEPGAQAPVRAHRTDAGFDLFYFRRLSSNLVDTGCHILIPEGYSGLVLPRSGLTSKGWRVSTGVIDAGYLGTIKVHITPSKELKRAIRYGSKIPYWGYNAEDHTISYKEVDPYQLTVGDRIAQLLILPQPRVELVAGEVLEQVTERGMNGFGSSGT